MYAYTVTSRTFFFKKALEFLSIIYLILFDNETQTANSTPLFLTQNTR